MKRSRTSRRHLRSARSAPRRATARAPGGALAPQDDGERTRQRIDKWLWHARMVRTRSDAATLADAGYVRINGKRIPDNSQPVRVGDVVTLALDRSVRVLRVEGFCERRGGSAVARALYRELTSDSGKIAPKTAAT